MYRVKTSESTRKNHLPKVGEYLGCIDEGQWLMKKFWGCRAAKNKPKVPA